MCNITNLINNLIRKILYIFTIALLLLFSLLPVKAHAAGYVTTENTGVTRTLQAGDRILLNVDIDQRTDYVGVSTISAIVNADGTLSNAYITRSLPGANYEIVSYLGGGTVTVDGLNVYAALGAQLYGGANPLTVISEQMNLISQLEPQSYTEANGTVNAWPEFGGLTIETSDLSVPGYSPTYPGYDPTPGATFGGSGKAFSGGVPIFFSPSVIGIVTPLTDLSGFYSSTSSTGGGYIDPIARFETVLQQSTLERVLEQINGENFAQVNGVFANVAESISSADGVTTTIDGSITNVVTDVTAATQEALAGVASATEFLVPTLDLGDMATTALGAVNTGEITLGVNSAVDEASTSTTNAISAVMTQIGGSADTGALVLNVASNASAVQGSIENTMASVNGSIGNLSTTALGAVNTGTITSGVNAAVQGIVGMSGQSATGL